MHIEKMKGRNKMSNINHDFINIPKELRDIPHWVCWAWEERNGKMTKVPKNPNTGYNAKTDNPNTWGTFHRAVAAYSNYNNIYDGIGWVFTEGCGYFGVDLDHCIDNKAFCDEFVDSLASYNEISTSGTGIHIICRGTLPKGRNRHNNVEMYNKGRYFVFTGNIYNPKYTDIRICTHSIELLHRKYLPEPIKADKKKCTRTANYNSISISDAELIDKIQNSKYGIKFNALFCGNWENLYASQSNADMALCCILAFWTACNAEQMDSIFRQSGLMRDKWDEFRGSKTYGQMTIDNAIICCCECVYQPESL
jgi:putative DNA primase/helicase